MEVQDDMESLYAQMEREYEEEEQKKKSEKKAKKGKAGKAGKEEEGDAAKPLQEESNIKKEADKKPKKKDKEKEKKPADQPQEQPEAKKENKENEKVKKEKEKNKDSKEKEKSEPISVEGQTKEEKKEDKTAKTDEAGSKKAGGKDAKGADKAGAKKKGGVSALKEALEAAKKKQEELERQEEEKLRQEEEARRKKEEEARLEKERKEKKKQKEKERIARLKQEGKYETKEQKEARERALLQLQAMGAKIPATIADAGQQPSSATAAAESGARKPKYERIRKKQTNNQTSEQQEGKEDDTQENGEDEQEDQEERIKDNWDDDENVKDEWDAESDFSAKTKSSTTSKSTKQSHSSTVRTTTTTSSSGVSSAAATKPAHSEEDESELSSDESGEEDSESESESEEEDENLSPIERARHRVHKRHEEAEKHRSTDNLRCPVICVLGHVDTGKTKILDNLRRTRVQEDEAGGITQQIGATNVPLQTIEERTKMCRYIYKDLIKIPGFLIIDTPGHESFKSLRSRGSSLCDIAILVIDIMHGLEPQTIESINILKDKKTPFVVALNKIDRLFGWKSSPQSDVTKVLESQAENVKAEFEKRTSEVIVQLAEQGLNASLYYKNPDPKTYISLVPTSAHTSDGIGNLMALLLDFSQTILAKRVSYSKELQCTVMEVKEIPGLGTTIDVCLVNGKLNVCDTIVIPGQEGPIVTQIRGLLLPQPNRELRVKNNYINNKEVIAAQGVKIVAKNLEKAMAGLPLFVAQKEDEIELYREELQVVLKQALSSIRLSDKGVFVQASTLGSLEALLEFLKTSKIKYAGISIGPVHKKDVTIASTMLEREPKYAVILAFDVKVERDAQDMADHLGVRIFTADIIYHLFDKFVGYLDELKQKKREEFKDVAVFPFKMKILPQFIFNTRDPIVVGVKIESGFVKMGSPVCAYCEEASAEREGKDKFVDLGRITSIEYNHKPLEIARQGAEVCIRIENTTGAAPRLLGRHFLASDLLISKISRDSIDAVKDYFRDEMKKQDWELIIELKKLFGII